ncbi:acyltransferase family protein [Butyrivibrio sp. VCB2006]|uniref:acyltransferase family protein n=1 Tax=Butyrivibrio sp. VCB2006 TaxID=1280679 RepID=UPI000414AC37|nr:acyltransferase family protein [Butyrivibrio sp. VCB2006]
MKDNKFLYAARFIACLAVITIHTRFPGKFGQIMDALARFAVPYFFAVSGRFLLMSDSDKTKQTDVSDIVFVRAKTSKALLKLLKITGIVYLIHLLFSFVYHISSGVSVSEWFSSKYNPGELLNFLMYNSGKVIYDGSYTFDHLWYLFALVYVYVLIYIFAPVLRKWYKGLIVILLFFLYLGMLLQTYYPIRPFGINICTWYVMRNWLFVGMPFVLIGVLFADYIRDKVDTLSEGNRLAWEKSVGPKAIIGILSGIILTIIETFIYGNKEVHFGSFFIVVGILFLAECKSSWNKGTRQGNGIIWKIGKKSSSNIYFYHVLIIAIIDILSQRGVVPTPPMWFKPLLIMAICVILFYFLPLLWEKRLKSHSST